MLAKGKCAEELVAAELELGGVSLLKKMPFEQRPDWG